MPAVSSRCSKKSHEPAFSGQRAKRYGEFSPPVKKMPCFFRGFARIAALPR